MNLKGKTIFVSGGRGFLGNHLAQVLLERGCAAVKTVASEDYDLRESTAALEVIRSLKPDVVFHLAARVGGIGYNKANPYTVGRDNLLLGLSIIDACAECRVPKLVIASSCCAYPSIPDTFPFSEESLWSGEHDSLPEKSNATYGLAKRLVGTLAAAAVEEKRLPCAVTLLLANLYGPGDTFDPERSHAIPAMIRKCSEAVDKGESVVHLWGTGRPTRDFLHVRDASEALVRVAEGWDLPSPLNAGTGIERSIAETAELIADIVGFSGRIEWGDRDLNGQMCRSLDCAAIWNALAWEPKVDFSFGLRETVRWWRENRDPK